MTQKEYNDFIDRYRLYLDLNLASIKDYTQTLHKNELLKFGYCPECSDITPYTANYGSEGCYERCHICHHMFDGWCGTGRKQKYLTGNDIPASLQEKAKILNSKNFQIDLLNYALKTKLKKTKEDFSDAQREYVYEMKQITEINKLLAQLKKD